jgi:hypothetical protein
MPKLLNWCDEASVVHWTQDSGPVSEWSEAYRRMVEDGRTSKVDHPSAAQLVHEIPELVPTRFAGNLCPVQRSA